MAGAARDGLPVAVGVAADAAAAAAHVMSVLVPGRAAGCPVRFRSSTEGAWPSLTGLYLLRATGRPGERFTIA